MKTVFKYPVSGPVFSLSLHALALPLFFAEQGGELYVWVQQPMPPSIMVDRSFQVFGTGHHIPDSARYVGTAMQRGFVWHLYEVTP